MSSDPKSLEPSPAVESPVDHAEHAEHDFTGPLSPGVRRFIGVFIAVAVMLLVADLFVDRKVHQPAERMPGFYAVYGFVGCVILVLVAKEMRKVVMRDESYYDPTPGDAGSTKGGQR